jgi:phosphoribosylformylglycinamidine synthase
MVGILNDVKDSCTMSFKDKGDLVFLLGAEMENGLGGSEYLELVHGLLKGKPVIDLDLERMVQGCCLEAVRRGLVKSAHDCSEGDLAVAIAESCLTGNIGFNSEPWKIKERLDSSLFGEPQSRIVVSVSPDSVAFLDKIAKMWEVPLTRIGKVGGERLSVKGMSRAKRSNLINLSLAEMRKAWRSFP